MSETFGTPTLMTFFFAPMGRHSRCKEGTDFWLTSSTCPQITIYFYGKGQFLLKKHREKYWFSAPICHIFLEGIGMSMSWCHIGTATPSCGGLQWAPSAIDPCQASSAFPFPHSEAAGSIPIIPTPQENARGLVGPKSQIQICLGAGCYVNLPVLQVAIDESEPFKLSPSSGPFTKTAIAQTKADMQQRPRPHWSPFHHSTVANVWGQPKCKKN